MKHFTIALNDRISMGPFSDLSFFGLLVKLGKVRGQLSSNDGDCAMSWALDGHGILMRSEWDAAPYLRSGRLRPILETWTLPAADIHLVFPTKANLSAKTRVFVDFVLEQFKARRAVKSGHANW